jgi:hypothetical protein
VVKKDRLISGQDDYEYVEPGHDVTDADPPITTTLAVSTSTYNELRGLLEQAGLWDPQSTAYMPDIRFGNIIIRHKAALE